MLSSDNIYIPAARRQPTRVQTFTALCHDTVCLRHRQYFGDVVLVGRGMTVHDVDQELGSDSAVDALTQQIKKVIADATIRVDASVVRGAVRVDPVSPTIGPGTLRGPRVAHTPKEAGAHAFADGPIGALFGRQRTIHVLLEHGTEPVGEVFVERTRFAR